MDDANIKPKRAYTRKTPLSASLAVALAAASEALIEVPITPDGAASKAPRKRTKKVEAAVVEVAPARPAKFGKNSVAITGARVVMSHSGPNRVARRAQAAQLGIPMARGTNTQVDKLPYKPGDWSYVPVAAVRSPGSRYGMTDARAPQARATENKGTLAGLRKRSAKRAAKG